MTAAASQPISLRELASTPPPTLGAFDPVAVESPGGGRVQDKRDPPASDVVVIRGIKGSVTLHRRAAEAWTAMLRAARADGIADPLLLVVSGYRSGEQQERLWRSALVRYGSPEAARRWVAPPGSSAHQSGRAVDLYLGARNDSGNVAQLRTMPAYGWLLTNARRFGFYPYEAEPWHWEYNPPAVAGRVGTPGITGPAPRGGGTRAGRLEVPTVAVLAAHRGNPPALVLRWNDMPAVPAEIDVVVHLHGYSRRGLSLPSDIEPVSGLDLAPVDGAVGRGRSRPTLTILPRGYDTGVQQTGGARYVYTFPALDGTNGRQDGVRRLVDSSLQQFATANRSPTPRRRRLILTAHSGGGAPLMRLLSFVDPDEVHVFDALYGPADALLAWARRHVAQDRGRPSAQRGAMRVFYRPGTKTASHSRRVSAALAPLLDRELAATYRVEASSLGHMEIPRAYGWRILADASADVPRASASGDGPSRLGPSRLVPRTGGPARSAPMPPAPERSGVAATEYRRFLQLLPLLDRHRGDIPLELLLGWIAVESDGRIDVVTRLGERGYFQIHPEESRDRHFDHQRLSTDPDYSVQAGVENVRYYAGLARQRFPSIFPGSELFWRVVKLQHALGSPLTRRLLDGMRADGIRPTWDAIRQYEINHGPQLHRLLRVRPLGRFSHNVDLVFERGRRLALILGRTASAPARHELLRSSPVPRNSIHRYKVTASPSS